MGLVVLLAALSAASAFFSSSDSWATFCLSWSISAIPAARSVAKASHSFSAASVTWFEGLVYHGIGLEEEDTIAYEPLRLSQSAHKQSYDV